jgi:hypothetical protein
VSDSYDYEQEDKAAAAEFLEAPTTADFERLLALRHDRDNMKELADAAEKEYRAHEAIVWEKMENNGDESLKKTLPSGETLRVVKRGTIYSRVVDLDTLLDSLEQSGRVEEMTKPAVEKKRLNELVRECLETGSPIPAGADFYERRFLQLTENA